VSAATWVGVALLGGAGAVARFVVDGAVAGRFDLDLPVGTLAVNLSGAFLLGLVAGLSLTGDALVLAGTATLGSYTTFSTWMLETQRLVEEGDLRTAAVNVVLSLAAGLLAVALGRAIA
jgi:fluoride exporter